MSGRESGAFTACASAAWAPGFMDQFSSPHAEDLNSSKATVDPPDGSFQRLRSGATESASAAATSRMRTCPEVPTSGGPSMARSWFCS